MNKFFRVILILIVGVMLVGCVVQGKGVEEPLVDEKMELAVKQTVVGKVEVENEKELKKEAGNKIDSEENNKSNDEKETKKEEVKEEVKKEEIKKEDVKRENKQDVVKKEPVKQEVKTDVVKKEVKEEVKKEETKKEVKKVTKPEYKVEKFSGDFMSEVDLNIRVEPSTDYKSVGYLKPYEKAVVSGKTTYKGSTWYKVTYKDKTGWASAKYLKPYKEGVKPKQSTASESNGKYKANHIYFNGKAVPYKNGGIKNGQAIIDTHKYASTWGGAEVFSGTDGLNTHLIGHNPGLFAGIWTAKEITVTDGKGTPFTYTVTKVYKLKDGTFYIGEYDRYDGWYGVINPYKGEMITVQTCVTGSGNMNWIMEATIK